MHLAARHNDDQPRSSLHGSCTILVPVAATASARGKPTVAVGGQIDNYY